MPSASHGTLIRQIDVLSTVLLFTVHPDTSPRFAVKTSSSFLYVNDTCHRCKAWLSSILNVNTLPRRAIILDGVGDGKVNLSVLFRAALSNAKSNVFTLIIVFEKIGDKWPELGRTFTVITVCNHEWNNCGKQRSIIYLWGCFKNQSPIHLTVVIPPFNHTWSLNTWCTYLLSWYALFGSRTDNTTFYPKQRPRPVSRQYCSVK